VRAIPSPLLFFSSSFPFCNSMRETRAGSNRCDAMRKTEKKAAKESHALRKEKQGDSLRHAFSKFVIMSILHDNRLTIDPHIVISIVAVGITANG
jgi:hypothetical protein